MMISDEGSCAHGIHRWSEQTDSGRRYCEICGAPHPSNAVDWSRGITPPGAVRLPTRDEALADARRLRWHPAPAPEDHVVILGRWGSIEGHWLIKRLHVGGSSYINGLPATHWCEDVLGTPLAPDGQSR